MGIGGAAGAGAGPPWTRAPPDGRAPVVGRQHRQAVGADLVGEIAVARPPGRRPPAPAGSAVPQQDGGHAVGEEGVGHTQAGQFPGGEPGPLQQGPGLVHENVAHQAGLEAPADDPQGGADARGGKAAGIAVGQHRLPRPEQRQAMPGHGFAQGHVLGRRWPPPAAARSPAPPPASRTAVMRSMAHMRFTAVGRASAQAGRGPPQLRVRGAGLGPAGQGQGGRHPDEGRAPHRQAADELDHDLRIVRPPPTPPGPGAGSGPGSARSGRRGARPRIPWAAREPPEWRCPQGRAGPAGGEGIA